MKTKRTLSQSDARALSQFAEQLMRVREVRYNTADTLIELIATSNLLPESDMLSDYITLNSTVTCRLIGTGGYWTIPILGPGDTDDTLPGALIMTPQAIALLGRRIGSIVEVSIAFNTVQYVEIVEVKHAPKDFSKAVERYEIRISAP